MPEDTNKKDLKFSQKNYNRKEKKYLSSQTEEELQQELLQPVKDLEKRRRKKTHKITQK